MNVQRLKQLRISTGLNQTSNMCLNLILKKGLLVCCAVALLGCSNDEETQPDQPEHIVIFGREEGVGEVIMNVDVRSGTTSTFNLLNDFGVFGFYSTQVIESTREIDFIFFENLIDIAGKVKTITYNVRTNEVEEEALDLDYENYMWINGASSESHVVLVGVSPSTLPEDSFVNYISINEKSSGTSQILEVCDDCIFNPQLSAFLISDNLFFIYYQKSSGSSSVVYAVDIQSKSILYSFEVLNPKVLIGETDMYIYSFNGTNDVIDVHDKFSFEKRSTFDFSGDIENGINRAYQNKAFVIDNSAQPAILNDPYIFDFQSQEVIITFTSDELEKTGVHFANESGFDVGLIPGIAWFDHNRNFILYSILELDGNQNNYGYVYSNFSSDYLGHVDIPHTSTRLLMVDWD